MTIVINIIDEVGDSKIRRFSSDTSIFFYRAGMMVDADGSPHAYHQDNTKGLDFLGNAGVPGDWWALVTDTGESDGKPIVQGARDPAPGFYISMTSLEDSSKKPTDPYRYVDAEVIPYFVLPSDRNFGAELGDFGIVVNPSNQKVCGCVFADIGPADEIGEGSISLAKALGINANPKNGGVADGLAYIVFPGTKSGWPLSVAEIRKKSSKLFEDWGGINKIESGLPNLAWQKRH
jgi:hypothetical protein